MTPEWFLVILENFVKEWYPGVYYRWYHYGTLQLHDWLERYEGWVLDEFQNRDFWALAR